jgi:hypothetical protein
LYVASTFKAQIQPSDKLFIGPLIIFYSEEAKEDTLFAISMWQKLSEQLTLGQRLGRHLSTDSEPKGLLSIDQQMV